MITGFPPLCLEATDEVNCLINANFINSVLTTENLVLVCRLRASVLLPCRPHPENHYGIKKPQANPITANCMHHNWEDRDRHKDAYKIEWEPFFNFEGISFPILFYTVEFLLLMLFPFSQFILSLLDVVSLHEQKSLLVPLIAFFCPTRKNTNNTNNNKKRFYP